MELRRVLWEELQQRRLSDAPGDYAYQRDGNPAPMYGVTGAANLFAELGFDFGCFDNRQAWCDRINAFQQSDGTYNCVSGPEHAASMAILALNILGGHPARPVRHLAPLDPERLNDWLNLMDWTGTTHKEFCGAVGPVLASGFGDAAWLDVLRINVEERIDPEQPLRIWSGCDTDPPWRVISCIYHVLCVYDAGALPYPYPALIWDRLMGLDYERTRNAYTRTACTDFDYLWTLYRLSHQLPDRFAALQQHAHKILDAIIAEWNEARDRILSFTTHELYCYCIGWAVCQHLLPDRFIGIPILDTLNAPWLMRLPGREWIAAPQTADHQA